MTGVEGAALAAFVGYLAAVVAIGAAASRFSSRGVGEFFVGARRMHRWVVALSAVVSGRSAWLLLGVTGLAWTRGASAVWAVVGYILAELLLFVFYAPRLRRFGERYDCVTVPDFFAARFDDRAGLRLLLVSVIVLFMTAYVASQFVAGGKTLAAAFGVEPRSGLLITALIVLAYTVTGGFLAVSLTDTLQAGLMLLALVALPVLAVSAAGGPAALAAELAALDPTLVDPGALGFGVLLGFLGIGLGSPGNPHILVRYLSIHSADQLRAAARLGTLWNVVMAWGALILGLAARHAYPDTASLPGGDAERIFPELAHALLPPVLFGLVVAAIFAAIMSTADSQLLVGASGVVRDLYQKILRRRRPPGDRELVVASRLVVIVLVGVSVALALSAEAVVFWLVLFAWGGLGAALGPTSVLALFWRRTTRAGVAAGIVAGATVTIVWQLTPALDARLYELIPGAAAGALATWIVSLLTRPPGDVDDMFRAMRGAEPGEGDLP